MAFNFLIVGGDSLIGSALVEHLQRTNVPVIETTRRREAVSEANLYLDLSQDVEDWQCPWPIDVAVVCAGITKLHSCKSNPVETARVNVQGVCTLVKNLVAQNTFVIYLSSNQVFDGSAPYRMPDDPISPMTEYGRQKAETDRQISQWGDSISIVRFTKVLGPKDALFSQWTEALRKGEAIRPFSDMFMAPVPLSCAVSVLKLIMDIRLPGITQVSGGQDISYEKAARYGAKKLQVDSSLIQPISAFQYGNFDFIPNHTTLNFDRLKCVLGIEPPDVHWTIEMAFLKPAVLNGFNYGLS